MGQIFIPSANEIPAKRFVVWSDSQNRTLLIDESSKQADAATFIGWWTSATLNRKAENFLWTISYLTFFYVSEAVTSVDVAASGDGGETWTENSVSVKQTTSRVEEATTAFNVTGRDIRVRFKFSNDPLVKIFGFIPHLVQRGPAFIGAA